MTQAWREIPSYATKEFVYVCVCVCVCVFIYVCMYVCICIYTQERTSRTCFFERSSKGSGSGLLHFPMSGSHMPFCFIIIISPLLGMMLFLSQGSLSGDAHERLYGGLLDAKSSMLLESGLVGGAPNTSAQHVDMYVRCGVMYAYTEFVLDRVCVLMESDFVGGAPDTSAQHLGIYVRCGVMCGYRICRRSSVCFWRWALLNLSWIECVWFYVESGLVGGAPNTSVN
jgi:hypothetical protein